MRLLLRDRAIVKAELTSEHACSSHGIPVLVLEDGDPLGPGDALLAGAQLVAATDAERDALHRAGYNLLPFQRPSPAHTGPER